MSTESSQKHTGSPSTPIPTVANGTSYMPSTTMVVVLKVPVITLVRLVVNTKTIIMSPFGSLFSSSGYNTRSIPSASSPFSYGMLNFTSQFSSSIPTSNLNPIIGLGGMAPPHIPLSFGGAHIPQTNPMVGSLPPSHLGSNPSINSLGWSGQPSGQYASYVPSFTPTPSTLISTNMFGMTNTPLSSGFPPERGQFHTMGNP
jgi:hypothetical protein